MVPRSILAVGQLGLIVVAVSACATGSSYLTSSASTTTLMAGWEYRFKLEWAVEPEKVTLAASPATSPASTESMPSPCACSRRHSIRQER